MKLFVMVLMVFMSTVCGAFPTNETIPVPAGANLLWDNASGVWRPMAGSASGTIEMSLATETAGITDAINVLNASVTSKIDTYEASATTSISAALNVMLGLSDNASVQRWFTAIVQGDGVNGNNTAGVAPWVFNGTTWDRLRGNASEGLLISERPLKTVGTQTYVVTDVSQNITAIPDRKWISFQNQGENTVTIHAGGTPAVYGLGRLVYAQGSVTYDNIDPDVVFSVVCNTGASTTLFVEQGAK